MTASIATLKNAEPGIYWLAVDMAARGKSARYIARELAWMLHAANEKRSMQGRPAVTLDLAV